MPNLFAIQTPEQVRCVTGIGGYQTGVTGSDRIRDGIALAEETEMGLLLLKGAGAEGAGGS